MTAKNPLPKVQMNKPGNNFEMIVGSICLAIAAYVLFTNFFRLDESAEPNNVLLIINTMAGLFLLNGGMRRRRMMKKFNYYVDFLNQDPEWSLSGLARRMDVPTDTIIGEFESFIRMKMLKDIRIDLENQRLVLVGWGAIGAGTQRKMKDINCEQCGAANQVEEGFMTECASCGHVIVDGPVPMAPHEQEPGGIKNIDCEQCGDTNQVEEGYMVECKSCGHLIIDD